MAQTQKKPTKLPDISRVDFQRAAAPIVITLDCQGERSALVVAQPKDFSTASYGWYAGEAVTVEVDGKMVKARLNLNLIISHSKNG